jgi:hypothetical protein
LNGSKGLKVQNTKKHIESKISDINQMLNELDFSDSSEQIDTNINPSIDINKLDVVDVLHNILN